LQGLVKIDRIYRAPSGREVEECTPLEISDILKDVEQHIKNIYSNAPNSSGSENQFQTRNNVQSAINQNQINMIDMNTKPINNQQNKVSVEDNSNKVTYANIDRKTPRIKEDETIISTIKQIFPEINETLEAVIFDNSMKAMIKVPVSDIVKRISNSQGGKLLVLDGIITQRLIEAANKAGIQYIIGHRTSNIKKPISEISIKTFSDIGLINHSNNGR
jgi:hypothetical protein